MIVTSVSSVSIMNGATVSMSMICDFDMVTSFLLDI